MHPSHHAVSHADKPAAILDGSGDSLSYAELERRSNRAAQLFRSFGLKAGDSICIMIENDPAIFELY